jgi:serine/threonine-protein kinase HipA
MGRRRRHAPLRVYLNGRLVGRLLKEPTGAVAFHYDESWLTWSHGCPRYKPGNGRAMAVAGPAG